jgi:hypothetical protein
MQQIKDGQTPPPPPEIIQLYVSASLLLTVCNIICFSFSHATTGALVGGSLGALVAYRHAKKAKLGYQTAMGGQQPHHRDVFLIAIVLSTMSRASQQSATTCFSLALDLPPS